MNITILGNGGALSNGLAYNSFWVDNRILVEAPPDIMNSLFRERIDLSKIKTIYISHFHGDHYFGIPFLVLRLFYDKINHEIKIIGPAGIKSKAGEICRLALGENHPVIEWNEKWLAFIEARHDSRIDLDHGLSLRIFAMNHFIETLGFSCFLNDEILFSYFADTIWSDDLLYQVRLNPKIILTDLGGEDEDPDQIHLSESDVTGKILPGCNGRTIIYGTHLKQHKTSRHRKIIYVRPGDTVKI
jgi:hypothetical protein